MFSHHNQPIATRLPHVCRQTAALLKQLQLEESFDFSVEEQQKYLARVFGHAAPAALPAAALPHGSSRVAAFLACSQAEAPVQQQQQQQPAAVAGAAATNPDEICLD